MEKITNFRGDYFFLSNLYIEPDKTHVEGEYQALKTIPPTEGIKRVFPYESKRDGKKLKLRPDWDGVKRGFMEGLVFKKFSDHADLRNRLIATFPKELVEENTWGDTYWGICNGVGENQLGKILMATRAYFMQWRGDDPSKDA